MSGAGDVSLAATIFGVAAALKAVNSGGVVAPHLTESLSDGHHRRHYCQTVIFNHLIVPHALA